MVALNGEEESYKHRLEKRGCIWEAALAGMLNSALLAVLRSALICPHGASQISVAAASHRVRVLPCTQNVCKSRPFFFFPTNNPYGGELLFNSGSKLIWFVFKC